MTYRKPANVTYTQMAQWVDKNVYSPDCDENILCQYLYHLVCIKTQQFSFFKDPEQLDDFCLYCVSRLLQRLRTPVKTEPIKSITNYIKTILSPWKADYVKDFCVGSYEAELADFDVTDYSDYLIDVASQSDFNTFSIDCLKVSDVLYKYLKKIPRKRNSCEWSNIYVSCLLTLQDRVRFAASLTTKRYALNHPQQIDRVIRALKLRPPILFHLDEVYSNYISVLVNELTHALAAEISYTTYSKVSVSACMRNLVAAATNEEDE